MGLLDLEIRFSTADEFVGGYLVHRHIASSGRKAHAMLPPSYVQGAKCPRPSPMYTYWPGGTGTPGQHPPIHVIFMAAIGRVLPSPSRFCMVEAPVKEWSFNDAPVPWILPAGYCNPNETVPDFPGDDNEAGGVPLTGASVEVTAVDGAEEEDGFEMVDDGEGNPATRWLFRFRQRRWQSWKVPVWVGKPQCLNPRKRMIPNKRNRLRPL